MTKPTQWFASLFPAESSFAAPMPVARMERQCRNGLGRDHALFASKLAPTVRHRHRCGVLALASFLAVGGSALAAQHPAPAEPVPPSYFGMHMHRAGNGTAWPAAPFKSWRLMDANVIWPDLEPVRGQWQFAILDHYVELAASRNVQLLLPLGFTPQWASARPAEASSYQPGQAAEPANLDDWRRYVRQVANRYKGKIQSYEIWNEPNLKRFFSGDVEQMVALAREAYRILKEVDPKNIVVSPAATGDLGVAWLEKYLDKGGGAYADVIGFHFYVDPQPPEAIPALVAKVRRVLARHGLGAKPLWNTEAGWLIANALSRVDPSEASFPKDSKVLSSTEAEAFVARANVLGRAAGLERFYWYAWDNYAMGLIEKQGALKPAAHAYRQTCRWLAGAVVESCAAAGQIWVCKLARQPTRNAWLVWNTRGAIAWRIPAAWHAMEYETLQGARSRIGAAPTQSSIKLGASPILLKSDQLAWTLD